MESKLIFLDVDGTLVNYENELPKSAVEAIHKAQGNGHKVYIATGRSKAEMYDYILDIGFDGYLGGNGSYVESDGQLVTHKTLSAQRTKEIVDWLHNNNLEFYLESNDGLFASKNFEIRGETVIQEYTAKKGNKNAKQMTVRKVFPDMIFGENLYRENINKISFILDSYQDYLDAVEQFPDLKVGTWGGAGETALFGDLALDGIDKAVGIEALLKYLGKDKEDTFAFGDAKVDIPMLDYCKIGVAMGSGGKEIKEIADFIADTVDRDGMYKAFEHFGLI